MKYTIQNHKLEFKYPFVLAHTSRDHTVGAHLTLHQGGFEGIGEVVFPPYYPETTDSFKSFLSRVELPNDIQTLDIRDYLSELRTSSENNSFALAALDMALHDLQKNALQVDIAKYYNITGSAKASSFTIGMSSNELMKTKLRDAESFSYIKLKVNESEIERIVNQYCKLSSKPFLVDANQGFTSRESALEWCHKLKELKVEYIEQPFLKDDYKSHRWLTERSPIPVIADESFQGIKDMTKVKNSFHGINIKLMKCGGILGAVECLEAAKLHKLKTVVGCMSESQVAIDAASYLSPLADWTDLDGPFLLKGITAL